MESTLLALSLANLAISAPASRHQAPHYPPTSSSQAFKLVANVTDPALDFSPSINNWVQGYHTGAGTNAAVLAPFDATTNPGRIFYQNGTTQDQAYHSTTLLTDAGSLPGPFSWQVQSPTEFDPLYPDQHHVTIGVGKPTLAYVASFPVVYPTVQNLLGQGSFVACKNALPSLLGAGTVVTVNYAYATFEGPGGGYEYNANILEGCVPISLIPQCAALDPSSGASHEFALIERCYEDVAAINWPEYGP
ncbi:hypothetical protein INS49_004169 [Diaporthe citri]|uniref:uncharacterized protein n=1 Tax=Diaporthe citri TaxID=83186 RepID=UPI001C7FC969|nr:uncharacterized protein INS49_004169 [Diaporthe citri]KAG6355088.1 hypothetical protein INS49_004169 [Diaporthe citri]